jgi:hypothetical protein
MCVLIALTYLCDNKMALSDLAAPIASIHPALSLTPPSTLLSDLVPPYVRTRNPDIEPFS